jgi:ABC-type antimicrobial peptide transport system permease subunit
VSQATDGAAGQAQSSADGAQADALADQGVDGRVLFAVAVRQASGPAGLGGLLQSVPPPDPRSLRDQVSTDLSGLFLLLAAVCLIIGAVGIANTTLVAVMERTGEPRS